MGDTPAQPAYSIKLSKEAFTFCSAHFITYAGDVCEPLHGHNYRTTVELSGPLDENAYVLDFVATRDAASSPSSTTVCCSPPSTHQSGWPKPKARKAGLK